MTPLRQLLRLPRTLAAIRRIIRDDCSFASADEHLWAFRGFHLESSDSHYRARSWQKAAIATIGPGDVVGLAPGELAFMMQVAMEIEDPIVEYSHQNGEGFRLLLPTLGRFMGRNDEERDYASQHGLSWCESPWCAEERRHGNLFAKLIERLTASAPRGTTPTNRALIRIGLDNYRGQRRARSGGHAIGANHVTAVEVVAAHLVLEYHLRKWLASLPLTTLLGVFETTSHLRELTGSAPGPEEQDRQEKRRQARMALARWRPAVRRRALAAPSPRAARRRTLRDEQIRNNRHVLANRQAGTLQSPITR